MTGSELIFLFITSSKNKQIKQKNKNKTLEAIETNTPITDVNNSRIFKKIIDGF